MLTGKVPICREDLIELDRTPNCGAASDAAEAKEAEANHFARLVVWRPMIMKTGVRTRAPSVNALNARRYERLSNNKKGCIETAYHQRIWRSVTRAIAYSM